MAEKLGLEKQEDAFPSESGFDEISVSLPTAAPSDLSAELGDMQKRLLRPLRRPFRKPQKGATRRRCSTPFITTSAACIRPSTTSWTTP